MGKNLDVKVGFVVCTSAADGFCVGNMIENGFEQLVLFQTGVALIEGVDCVLHPRNNVGALLDHQLALCDFTLDGGTLGNKSSAFIGEHLAAFAEILRRIYTGFDQFKSAIFASFELL